MSDTLILASFVMEAVFWIGAYVLIVRGSFKNRIHYMPVAAMCGNIGWEVILGLDLFPPCPVYWANCPDFIMQPATMAAALLDVLILYTILRFGRDQFKYPALRRYFTPLVLAAVALGFVLNYGVMSEMYTLNVYGSVVDGRVPTHLQAGLQGGLYTGWGLALMMGVLFIATFFARRDLRGQSFLIALFMGLGNLGAYFFDLTATGGHLIPLLHLLAIPSLAINAAYAVLLYNRSRALGVNPWRI
jgi:hypothetical protein